MPILLRNSKAHYWYSCLHIGAALLLFQSNTIVLAMQKLETKEQVINAIAKTPTPWTMQQNTEIRNAISALPISALEKVGLYGLAREQQKETGRAAPAPQKPSTPPTAQPTQPPAQAPAPLFTGTPPALITKSATSASAAKKTLDTGLITAQLRSLIEPLEQTLSTEPFSAATVQKYIKDIEEKITQLGGFEKIPTSATDLRTQLPALLEQAKQMVAPAPSSPTPPSPTSQERLQEEVLVISTQIKTSPLNFEQYKILLAQIRALSTTLGTSTLVKETQATLSKELETAFAKILPALEIQNLIDTIAASDWTTDLRLDVEAQIKKARFSKELETELLNKLNRKTKGKGKEAPAGKPGMPTPKTPITAAEKIALLARVKAVDFIKKDPTEQTEIKGLIDQILPLAPASLPHTTQQEVPQQTEADCGYHALKNAIIIALQAQGQTVAPKLGEQLLAKWKKIISERRQQTLARIRDPKRKAEQQAHYQGTDWLEWTEIEYLYDEENKIDGILHNKQITITISEDPFNMWHEFISLRTSAQEWIKNRNYTHMFVIGTATQKESGTVKSVGGGHWFTLVAHKKNDSREYITADSVNFIDAGALIPDRRTDPRTQRLVELFEGLTSLYGKQPAFAKATQPSPEAMAGRLAGQARTLRIHTEPQG